VATVALFVVLVPSVRLADLPPPIFVRVEGSVRVLAPGTTLGQVRRAYELRPESGDLVDVEGVLLEPDVYPGRLSLNGGPASDDDALVDGDEIRVVDGADRTEPLRIVTRTVPGGVIPNPQTYLGTAPGEEIITTGEISGKLVGSELRPTGEADPPRSVALTFDDGPSPTYTPRVLAVLRRFGVPATFFMVGSMVDAHPEEARAVVDAGMAVGNHTYGHPSSPSFADQREGRVREEIERAGSVLAGIADDVEVGLFRPPGGSWDQDVVRVAEEEGLRTVLWSVDSLDWQRPNPELLVRRVMRDVRPGSIILLHDGGGDRSATVTALPEIIRRIRARGLAFETP
jgi:peptidoglycan-N-acetylglucosamine deacetylase